MTDLVLYQQVADQMRELVIAGTPGRHIIFNHEGLTKAKSQEGRGIDRFQMGGPDTYMGLPFKVDPDQDELVKVSPDFPPPPKLMNYRVGTPAEDYQLTVERLRDICDAILDIDEPSPQIPIPMVLFPRGFYISYATRERPLEL